MTTHIFFFGRSRGKDKYKTSGLLQKIVKSPAFENICMARACFASSPFSRLPREKFSISGVGQKFNGNYHVGLGAPPILEPMLVGIGMFTGGTIWILSHGQIKQPREEGSKYPRLVSGKTLPRTSPGSWRSKFTNN